LLTFFFFILLYSVGIGILEYNSELIWNTSEYWKLRIPVILLVKNTVTQIGILEFANTAFVGMNFSATASKQF
jgi:hypothetical protein